MRIKLQDAASRAGVSEATVSRVINGKTGVSAATKASVVRVLADLGYDPPSLRDETRLGSIGLIVPELGNPVFPAFAQAIESRLLANGYVSILGCAGGAGASEDDYVETMLAQGVAGLIIVSGRHADISGDHSIYADLFDDGTPLVLINGRVEPSQIPSVSSDDTAAAISAYEHLHALGHERIGLLTGPVSYVPVRRKLDGFRAAAQRAGVGIRQTNRRVAETMFSVEGGSMGADLLLAEGVTGIVAASDIMALGAILMCRQQGFEVPADVSIVGYDDTDLMRFTDPPLTTVRQPVEKIAEHATAVLLAQITGQRFERREYLVRGDLIGRSSTARASLRVG